MKLNFTDCVNIYTGYFRYLKNMFRYTRGTNEFLVVSVESHHSIEHVFLFFQEVFLS